MTFHEDWFGPNAQEHTLAALRMAPLDAGALIEVGCWEGRSTAMLANAIYPRTLHAIDHFQGGLDLDESTKGGPGPITADLPRRIARKRNVRATFERNMQELTKGNVELHCVDWRDYFESWCGPIAFIHIDGAHDYWSVRDNIEVVLPWLVPLGVIVGDDWPQWPVKKAALDVLKTPAHKHRTWWWVKPE